jgi:hypothetical protein
MSFWGDDILSQDFYKTIPPVTVKETEWYQCVRCRMDLRGGRHRIDCGLTPGQMEAEFNRVNFIIRQIHKHRVLTVKEGGNDGSSH